MRKSIILAMLLALGMSANAQKEVIKDAEHMLKGSTPDYAGAIKTIKPALDDATTGGQQEAWYVAGKASNGLYDALFLKESMGQNPSKDEKRAGGQALVDAVNYYIKAANLPDEKGKTPGKKTKEIVKVLESLYPQTKNAGIFLLQSGDYDGAYNAWELYVNYPNNPLFGQKGITADPDTIVGQILYYQAIAMLSNNKNDLALEKLKAVVPTGFKDIDVYRYAVEAANRLGNKPELYDFAQKGYDLYGTQDILFIGQLINSCLEKNDYDRARTYINEAIEKTPQDNVAILCQLYDILGNVDEQSGKPEEAIANFDKALSLDANYAKGYFDKARIIYNTAIKEDENSETKNQSRNVTEELKQAGELFKKAYEINPEEMSQIPGILYRLYYRLGAGYEDEAEKWNSLQ